MFEFPERFKIVEALAPAADAGGRTSDVVSLKNVHRAWVVVHILQGAANTVAITLEQASAVANTGHKVLTVPVPIWVNLDCATSDVMAKATSAVGYTTDAGVTHKIIIFQVDASYFDIANGFDCLTVITGASAAANITEATFYLEGRYAGPVASMPSAIID